MQKTNQFRLFGKKGIMAMGSGHFPILCMDAGGANCLGKVSDRGGRKEPVGADSHKTEPGLDSAKYLGCGAADGDGLPGVHGAQDGEVGIGVEAIDEPFALVVKVAGNIESPADETAALVVEAQGSSPFRFGLRANRSSNRAGDL